MNMRRLTFSITLLLAMAAAGCARREAAERAGAGASGPVAAVRALRVGATDGADVLVLPARVAAREEVTVTATIAGRVTSFPYAEGQRFPAGAAIAVFGTPETRAALDAARAALDAASARLDLARTQEGRLDSLYAQRVAALHELELAREDRHGAEAARAQAEAAEAALRAGAEVRAPFAGVVVRRHLDPGVSVGPGEPLLDIRSTGADEIVAAVPEGAAPALRDARVAFQAGDGAWRPATLWRVDGMTDFSTRTRTARFVPAERGAALEPGAFARVRIERRGAAAAGGAATRGSATTGTSSAPPPGNLVIPAGSLVHRGGLTGVYVLRDGRATLRWVRLGRVDGAAAEVLAGLSPGEEIAADPAGLSDGRAVTVKR
jgi:RND family efflux transporter MFP subunit